MYGHTQYDMESATTELARVPQELYKDKSSWKFACRRSHLNKALKDQHKEPKSRKLCVHAHVCVSVFLMQEKHEQNHSCKTWDDSFQNVHAVYYWCGMKWLGARGCVV